jgi:hypothetical protein
MLIILSTKMLCYRSKVLGKLLHCLAEKGIDSVVIGQVIKILYGGIIW